MASIALTDVAPGESPGQWSIELHCLDGGSDKLYNLALVPEGDKWMVNYQNGRRGKPLASGTLTKQGALDYPAARKKALETLKEKLGKHYEAIGGSALGGDAPARSIVLTERTDTGYRPQLLRTITPDVLDEYLDSREWVMQIKWDGERRGVMLKDRAVTAAVRKGFAVDMGAPINAALAAIDRDCDLDAEQVGDVLYVFDITMADGKDLRSHPLAKRLAVLARLPLQKDGAVRLVGSYIDPKEKRKVYDWARANGLEGVVFKYDESRYEAGRSGEWVKLKFLKALTAIATPNADRRSVAIHVLDDDGRKIDIGNVTIPPNHPVPDDGAIIEVRYRHANPGGALQETAFLKVRGDMDASDCHESQREYPAEDAHDLVASGRSM